MVDKLHKWYFGYTKKELKIIHGILNNALSNTVGYDLITCKHILQTLGVSYYVDTWTAIPFEDLIKLEIL